jgi:NAD(P)-dependent dehydrogenase (short-subunit alcohol dehydrogenase family)
MIRVVGSGKRNRRENMGVLDKFNLDSKVVVVTGASSGLGSSFVLLFAEAGANIAMGARRIDRLEALQDQVKAAGRSAVSCRTDVAVPEDCAALADLAFEQFGRIDVLINSAGIGASVPASREAPEDFRKVIEVNLMGSYGAGLCEIHVNWFEHHQYWKCSRLHFRRSPSGRIRRE